MIALHTYAQTANPVQSLQQVPIKNTAITDSVFNKYDAPTNAKMDSVSKRLKGIQQVSGKKIAKAGSEVKNTNDKINKQAAKVTDEEQSIRQVPQKYVKKIGGKIDQYDSRITKKTEKTLTRLSKWEDKIHSALQKTSPQTAERLFGKGQMTFSSLLQKLKNGDSITTRYQAQYNSYNDKLTTRLKYLEQQKSKLDSNMIAPVTEANKKMALLNKEEDQSAAIQQFIKERKKQLMSGAFQYLKNSKYLAKINKESFYYTETLKNYKGLFNDPAKTEQAVSGLLNKMPFFHKFFQQNSQLSSLFSPPGAEGSGSGSSLPTAVAALQPRAQILGMMQQKIGSGPNAQQAVGQYVQDAQAQMSQLNNKATKPGSSGNDMNMPDFKPNMQKTKTFLQRMEFGSDIQFEKNNSLMPAIADIAVSAGYKLNDKSIAGLGASYKIGMGTLHHIELSTQGVGLRSFLEWKFKKQVFITGGFEMNNYPAIAGITVITAASAGKTLQAGVWQKSGLIGLTKKMNVKAQKFKATSIQVLYDMLYNTHVPRSQPFVFRMGYNF
jgi:hypothetical protein